MRARVRAFLDERTGLPALLARAFDAQLAGGAAWAHAWGVALLALFVVEAFTGALLMLTYAPTVGDAWSSVYFIQHRTAAGWFLRGMHANVANAMLLVTGLHLVLVVLRGAHQRPREVTWWLGLALAGLVLGLVITGYRLPWDQRTYWALKVELNITESMPLVGDALARLVNGGGAIGQRTLTRLYAAHVLLLPGLLVGLIVAKRALIGLHGRTAWPRDAARSSPVFPDQWVRNAVVLVFLLGGAAALAVVTHGEGLDAPAEPDRFYSARPEWFLLPLFKLRMLLPPELELAATALLPALLGGLLFGLPFLDRSPAGALRARLPVLGLVGAMASGAVALTGWAMWDDLHDKKHQSALREAAARASRAKALASRGIPPEGPVAMMMGDPLTRGADVYRQYCTSCHVLGGEGKRKSPDHDGFGSRPWIFGLLLRPQDHAYFGKVKHDERMPSQKKHGDALLRDVTEFLYALGQEPGDAPVDEPRRARGEAAFAKKCVKCHVYEGEGDDLDVGAPDLTGWGSRTWIFRQVRDPASAAVYGALHKMPAFSDQLSEHDLWMVAGFVRAQRYQAASP